MKPSWLLDHDLVFPHRNSAWRRRFRKRSCRDKRRYRSEFEARQAMSYLMMNSDYDGRSLHVYRCHFHLDHYHFGHASDVWTRLMEEQSAAGA